MGGRKSGKTKSSRRFFGHFVNFLSGGRPEARRRPIERRFDYSLCTPGAALAQLGTAIADKTPILHFITAAMPE